LIVVGTFEIMHQNVLFANIPKKENSKKQMINNVATNRHEK
jgi:hypothetical protein